MKISFIIAVLTTALILNGCAVFGSERGVFVSSTVQTVPLSIQSEVKEVRINPFSYPSREYSDTQTNTAFTSGTLVSVSHTYVFDEIDKVHLRQSLVNSLEASGIRVAESSENVLDIRFLEIGIVPRGMHSALVLVAETKLKRLTHETVKTVSVRGKVKATIAGSKNQAMREFIMKLSSLFGE